MVKWTDVWQNRPVVWPAADRNGERDTVDEVKRDGSAAAPPLSASEVKSAGALLCVGLGMTLGAHLTPQARLAIEQAERLFGLTADGLTELWLRQLRPDLRSLQSCYVAGQSRQLAYAAMRSTVMTELRAGRRVCVALYGHPGVFAQFPHQLIQQARAEGYSARMEAAVSAADCLYADLGIDPGRHGCQHYEATQYLLDGRRSDPQAYLVLWQLGVVGDRSLQRTLTGPAYRSLLLRRLMRDYPAEHDCWIYEAANHALEDARIESLPLWAIAEAKVSQKSTLVLAPIPLAAPFTSAVHAELDALDAEARCLLPPDRG